MIGSALTQGRLSRVGKFRHPGINRGLYPKKAKTGTERRMG